MAPEAVKDGIATDKCDIWACGVLLYFLLSGQLPFKVCTFIKYIKGER
jgi:serine/threonine protein kinase